MATATSQTHFPRALGCAALSFSTLAALTIFSAGLAHAGDWPQWNGPHRDAHADETGLLKTWPADGPKLLWSFKDAGVGIGAPAVVAGKVFALGSRKGNECVIALDNAGKEIWISKIAPPFDFEGNDWSLGPNSTPAVDGDALFALGSQGVLVCVETATGKERWRKDLVAELGAEVNPIGGGKGGWGFSWSPLVDGDNVIITPGGAKGLVAALNKKTGAVVWQTRDIAEACTYASPIVVEAAGVRQYVALKQSGAVGIEAKTGKLLWSYRTAREWPDIAAVTPIFRDGQVFITAWKGGCDLFKIERKGDTFDAVQVWAKNTLGNAHGGVVLHGGNFYGSHDMRAWRCLDIKTGEQTSDEMKTPGVGAVTVADGMMYILSQDTDTVSLVEMTPPGAKVAGKFKLPAVSQLRRRGTKAWAHPVVADGRLYIREQEMIFCYQVR